FRGNPFAIEANVILAISVISVIAIVLGLIENPTSAVGAGRWLVAFWSLWGVVILVRKRFRRSGEDLSSRDKIGMAAVACFLLVVTVSATFTGFNLILGSARSVSMFIVGQILQFTVVLAFPVVYVQYAPEPTTFQVKLVGFVLLIVLAVFGVLVSYQSGLDDHRQRFDPAPAPRTVSFLPAGDGYELAEAPLSFDNEVGDNLRLLDDGKVLVDLPFVFPFAGDSLSSIVVTANGALEPVGEPYPPMNFSRDFPIVSERPLIAVWYTDLNPGAAGSVHADVRPDRVVVTWMDVPEWNYFYPHTLQAVVYETGQIDFNYTDLPFDTYVGASGILANPSQSPTNDMENLPGLDGLIGVGAISNPFVTYDRRREFKEYLHAETMPFVWVVLGTILFILAVAPVFFRLALTRPLDRLLMGMRRVNDGDLDAELPLGVKDEFGYLAQNFNHMTNSLREYSGEMESLVAERTRELNESLESLKSTQEQLVQQEKLASLGQLTAGIAHEIKNPLNFINNFAELNAELADELLEALEKGEDPSEIVADLRQNATVIAEHGTRADSIVRSMMEHARDGSAAMEVVEVNAFVDEYLNLAYHGHRASKPDFNVTLDRQYGDDAGSVQMIRQDMSRVLINLIGNAFDALSDYSSFRDEGTMADSADRSDSGAFEPAVRVATSRTSSADGRDRVIIEISDNGPGVPDDVKQRIFEPFFTTKPPGQGTGLGLSLSYDIVTSGHGGTLELSDRAAGGAKFVLSLPA
ncbi:MAG: HAMP domain-containing protein, partial [Rhodothermales bacterium]|nr:HAMP domain-containing protein [Rhodothermales bacterium]